MSTCTIRERYLYGCWEVEPERGGRATSGVRGVLLVCNGWVDEIWFAVTVDISHSNIVGDVWAKICQCRVRPRSDGRRRREGDVFEVSLRHSNGINGSIVVHITDVQGTEGVGHVDNMRTCLSGGREGVCCWKQICLTVEFDDGHVIIVTRVGCLTGCIVNTFAAQEPDVLIVTLSGETLLGLAPITDFETSI